MQKITIKEVRAFWESNPLCASMIPHPLGSEEWFRHYDLLREGNESPAFSSYLHKYRAFAGKKVLDVGCGNGYVLSRYAQEGAQVVGVDVTAAAIRLCRQRFGYGGLAGSFMVANAEQLPFAADGFDCVCSMGVLHHTPDTAGAVAEIFRVLKPGGYVVAMFYHRNSMLYRLSHPLLRSLTGKSRQQLVNEFDGAGNPKGEVYSKAELGQLFGKFTDLEMFAGYLEGWMLVPKIGKLIPKGALKPFEKRWGWFLYVRGFKPGGSRALSR
jgi:ubiquinone/menaquinone biosynthesis C-methylase UbiE